MKRGNEVFPVPLKHEVVAMIRLYSPAALALLLGLIFPTVLPGQCPSAQIDPTVPADGDEFGYDVDIDGDVLLVGARYVDGAGPDAGAAEIFRFDGANWVSEAMLMDTNDEQFEQFGWSVAISGDVAVVGAHFDAISQMGGGAAFVYRYDGITLAALPGRPVEKIVEKDRQYSEE